MPEVWFWQADQILIFRLREENYQEVSRSEFFPLDIALLLRYIRHPDQYDAVNEFTQAISS